MSIPSISWKLKLKIPWVGELEVSPDKTQQLAAWSLYVELMTASPSSRFPMAKACSETH